MSTLVVVVADLHVGSTLGLLPAEGVEGEDGQRVHPSQSQRWLWNDCWLPFWQEAATLKTEGTRCIGILNGDLVDGDNLKALIQRWTVNRQVQERAVVACLSPARAVVDHWYVTRGTPFHSGAGGQADEHIAQALKARKIASQQTAYRALLRIEHVLLDVAHAAGLSYRPWTRGGPAIRLGCEIKDTCAENNLHVPDLVIRNHAHKVHDSGTTFRRPRVIIGPAWQLATEHVQKSNPVTPADIGGILVLVHGGAFDVTVRRYYPAPLPEVRA